MQGHRFSREFIRDGILVEFTNLKLVWADVEKYVDGVHEFLVRGLLVKGHDFHLVLILLLALINICLFSSIGLII
jgi:hypothetical protein